MTAYGEPDVVPTPETAPCRPVSYYGVTKYAAERYAQIAGALPDSGLAVTSLRMFNVYGERQSLDNPYQGVLAIFLGNVLRGEPITIHGDGLQTRDFVYVADVVGAWLSVLDEPATAGHVFNVGSGVETCVGSARRRRPRAHSGIQQTPGTSATPRTQRGDQRRSLADIGLLGKATGWAPETELAEGMAHTVAWARDNA